MDSTGGSRFRQARRVFEELVDLEVAERRHRLADLALADPRLADAVVELLEADRRAQGFLSSPAAHYGLDAPPTAPDVAAAGGPAGARVGERFGAYRLIELLGAGGMGEVYLAERVDGRFEQRVALKLVKRGMDSAQILRRFARERQILARLEHPGIARLLDGGEGDDGRPYFVMERVEGEPITEYCAAHGAPLEERLRLLADCCDAVDAAHRSLVVHRDLKPSNILVTAGGRVKLLDFGIARLLGDEDGETQLTRHGAHVLTPAYAAPEQILGGGVSMATDVFALGVVMYELLTGALPHDRRAATPYDLVSRVERESAQKPSTLVRKTGVAGGGASAERKARRLRGDLDTIALKALAPDPARRYPSAAAFAADLRAYLDGRPVSARPDTPAYRLRKFVGRHRAGVAASIAVALALVAALIVSLVQTAAARRQAERAAAAQTFLASLFSELDPDRMAGAAPTVRDLLESGSQRLSVELAEQPELRAEMELLVGQVFSQLSLPDQAEPLFRRALDRRKSLDGADDPRTAEAQKRLAISLHRQARYGEAEPLLRELLARAERLGDEVEVASVLSNYGNLERQTGDYQTAAAMLERGVALSGRVGDLDSRHLATTLNNLGLVYWRQQRLRAAVAAFSRALAIHRKNAPDSALVAGTLQNLCELHRDLGELDAAQSFGEQALALQRSVYPANHPAIGGTLTGLAALARRRGDSAAAGELYRQSIATYEASQRPDHPDVVWALRGLAGVLRAEGKTAEAVAAYERALAVRRKAFGDRHPEVAQSWQDLARGRLAADDLEGALTALRTGVEIYRATLPADSSQLAGGLFFLGDVLRLNSRARQGIPFLEEALAIWERKPPANGKDLENLRAALEDARRSAR
jgi:serine/threonine-protein kinase